VDRLELDRIQLDRIQLERLELDRLELELVHLGVSVPPRSVRATTVSTVVARPLFRSGFRSVPVRAVHHERPGLVL
jgi:hypothetical protein